MSRTRLIVLYLAIFGLIAVAFGTQSYMAATLKGHEESWLAAMTWALSDWVPRMVLFPLVLSLARRWPLERDTWVSHLPVHLVGLAVFSTAQSYLYFGGEVLTDQWWLTSDQPMTFGQLSVLYLTKSAAMNLIVYSIGVGLVQGLRLYQKYRERERKTLQLQNELATAQLETLKGQLQPHFLFNTLNTIAALVRRDPDNAELVLTRLADLLRASLQSSGKQEVSLRQELDFAERFLDIQRIRFRDRLTIEKDVPDAVLEAVVPSLILQPIIENAIRHGIEPQAEAGVVAIAASRVGDRLQLEVTDNGRGLPPQGFREGIGIGNTRARLEQLYNGSAELTIKTVPGGGTRVRITIPYSEAAR